MLEFEPTALPADFRHYNTIVERFNKSIRYNKTKNIAFLPILKLLENNIILRCTSSVEYLMPLISMAAHSCPRCAFKTAKNIKLSDLIISYYYNLNPKIC